MSLVNALADVVWPAIRAVFEDGEVITIAVAVDPAVLGGSITLSLTAVGEDFTDLAVQGDVTATALTTGANGCGRTWQHPCESSVSLRDVPGADRRGHVLAHDLSRHVQQVVVFAWTPDKLNADG